MLSSCCCVAESDELVWVETRHVSCVFFCCLVFLLVLVLLLVVVAVGEVVSETARQVAGPLVRGLSQAAAIAVTKDGSGKGLYSISGEIAVICVAGEFMASVRSGASAWSSAHALTVLSTSLQSSSFHGSLPSSFSLALWGSSAGLQSDGWPSNAFFDVALPSLSRGLAAQEERETSGGAKQADSRAPRRWCSAASSSESDGSVKVLEDGAVEEDEWSKEERESLGEAGTSDQLHHNGVDEHSSRCCCCCSS